MFFKVGLCIKENALLMLKKVKCPLRLQFSIYFTFIYANHKDRNKANEQNEADVLHSLSLVTFSVSS